MSFDLIVRAATPARALFATLAREHACESHAVEGSLVIAVAGDDARVAKVYRAIVELAREHSAVIHDPQRGIDVDLSAPGLVPPGWEPSGAVHGRSFSSKVESFLVDHLRPHRFERRSASTAVRVCDQLVQGVYVQSGQGRRSGLFTVSAYWTFTLRPLAVAEAMDAVVSLHEIAPTDSASDANGGWLASKPTAALDRSFSVVRRVFRERMLPLLDEAQTIEGIVRAFEAGRLSVIGAFGRYTTAQNMADCYRTLGRIEDGKRRFDAYLASFDASSRPDLAAWIEAERAQAQREFGR